MNLKTSGTQTVTGVDTVASGITGGQSVTVSAAAATHFALSGGAGGTAPFTQHAVGAGAGRHENLATAYGGTVHFTSTDGAAVLPANYVFTSGDAGAHTFTGGVTLKTAGTHSVTATDTITAMTGSQSGLVVQAGAVATLAVTGITGGVAGTAKSVTVTAQDGSGNAVTTFAGTVHFSSTDPQATLPSDYTFVAGDNGTHTFTGGVVLKTAGTSSVTATDTVTASLTGTQSGLVVTVGSATQLTVTGVTGGAAGVISSPTVTAKDAYNNTATGYTGTVHFASPDAQAVVPGNYAFVAGDAGVHTFTNGVVLKTVGTQSLAATDTGNASITGVQSGLVVTPAGATQLAVTGASGGPAGVATSATVTAKDAFGNTATGYTGVVHFTSTDPQASLPASYTFVAGDSGAHSSRAG